MSEVLLAVEDEPSIVDLLRALAAPLNLEVVGAGDGAEALELMDRLQPAVVTLDLVLPVIDGLTVLDRLRAQPAFETLPVIVVTAVSDPTTHRRAYALGATDLVTKPFNVDVLAAKLRTFSRLGCLARDVRQGRTLQEAQLRAVRNFAHEVRNPLTAIAAAAQVYLRGQENAPLRERMARAIEGEAHRVAELVRAYVERQPHPVPTAAVDLALLLEEVLEFNLVGLEVWSRIAVALSPTLPRLRADASRLKQVVLNLVLNAIAATTEGGAITLAASEECGGVILRVIDTGRGIAEEHLPRIFEERFTTRPDGEGLGLPIARRIVEEHGGNITVESKPGAGTTFHVWLPAV